MSRRAELLTRQAMLVAELAQVTAAIAAEPADVAPATPAREIVDVPQLAKLLGVSIDHVRRLAAKRAIPSMRVGDLLRFDVALVLDALAKAEAPPIEPSPVRLVRKAGAR